MLMSSVDKAPLRYEYQVLLCHPEQPRVLLAPDGSGRLALPGFSLPERRFWQDVDHVNWAMGERYGAPVTTLRCVAIDYQRDVELLSRVYALELHDPLWTPPPGAIWAGRADLDALGPQGSRQQQVAATWLDWLQRPTPVQRAPWYTPGWYHTAVDWIDSQLARLRIARQGPIVQLRSWQRSAILRVATGEGELFFKAVPPMFGHEPALTAALAAIDPRRFAATLAVDAQRGWLLMRGLRGRGLDAWREIEDWEAALQSFAEIQIATIDRLSDLRALGVPERRLDALTVRIEPLLSDASATLPGQPAGLNDEQRATLRDLVPRLQAMSAELSSFGLPATLEHGDLWPGQIIGVDSGYAFIDWSDSSIAHPFFSLLLFLVEIEDYFPKAPGIRNRLRDAYLKPWRAFGGSAWLEHTFELAQPLAALHQALTYQEVVLPNMELRWEMELMVPFYLKMLLRLTQQHLQINR